MFRRKYFTMDPQTGKRVQRRTKKWYAWLKNGEGILRRVSLASDRTASQTMLNEMVKKAELTRVGLSDPFEESRKRPLTEHLADFQRYLESKGNTFAYAGKTVGRVRAILDGCKFKFMADVTSSAVVEWLAGEREAGRMGIKTSNYYLRDVKAFCYWLVKDRRTNDNPLAHLAGMNATVEAGRQRRTLSEQEFSALVDAARQGASIRGLNGIDRAILYTVASYVGFRASELASLTPESFDLDSDPATVTVEAAYSKRRRCDVQSLRPDLAGLIRDWLKGKQAGERLWPGNPKAPSESWQLNAAEMVRADLETASANMKMADPKSKGIPYRDEAGGVFDFHSLRHQFISNLVAGDVNPKVCQSLARHSTITLTMDRYSHLGLFDQATALDKLPPLPWPSTDTNLKAATGTDGKSDFPIGTPIGTDLAQTADFECNLVTTIETAKTGQRQRQDDCEPLELKCFDNTCNSMATDGTAGRAHSSTAEQGTHNPLVPGSNPGGPNGVTAKQQRRL